MTPDLAGTGGTADYRGTKPSQLTAIYGQRLEIRAIKKDRRK
jgi:hypothetical protein